MKSEEVVRSLRKLFVRIDRPIFPEALTPAQLKERRERRKWRKRLFESSAFQNLITHADPADPASSLGLGYFVLVLLRLKSLAEARVSPDHNKHMRAEYIQAQKDVQTTARVLRAYADHFLRDSEAPDSGRPNRKMLLDAADLIEAQPWLAAGNVMYGLFEFSLMGQKGDLRAFLIREIDSRLPSDLANRDAMIRDLLELIGVQVSSNLVRSTRLNGRT